MHLLNNRPHVSLRQAWLPATILYLSLNCLIAELSPGKYPINNAIEESDLIVEGTILIDKVSGAKIEKLRLPTLKEFDCVSVPVPFKIDQTLKGNTGNIINVKLFCPANSESFPLWLVPKNRRILLVLKRSANSDLYYLEDPRTCWLPLIDKPSDHVTDSDPKKAIVFEVKSFLSSYPAHPETRFDYFDITHSGEKLSFDEDPSIIHALDAGLSLDNGDTSLALIVEKYAALPGRAGQLAQEIEMAAGKMTLLQKQLTDYSYGKLNGSDSAKFLMEIANGIRTTNNIDQLAPFITTALAIQDTPLRLRVTAALTDNKSKDKRLYPALISLLDDPNREVQAAAMTCIFYMSGSDELYYSKQEIHLPAYQIFLKNPDSYVKEYKAWWEKHKDSTK